MSKTLTVNSYAKLNLYLAVLNKRRDHYHNLVTIFERIDLCDKITLKLRRDNRIKLVTSSSTVPKDQTNLAWKSAKLLQETFHLQQGVEIKLVKRIPVASGMAGGSSNAAAVLMGLNKLWKLDLTQARLARLAAKIGADVPFFIFNAPFARGVERGDKIRPLKKLHRVRLWHILVVPKFGVSTPLIFKKWDELPARARLTTPKSGDKLLALALARRDRGLISRRLFNGLEGVTFASYPRVRAIKQRLAGLGVKLILMSGSGPAVFGVLFSRKEAVSLSRQLKRERNWRVFITRTI